MIFLIFSLICINDNVIFFDFFSLDNFEGIMDSSMIISLE